MARDHKHDDPIAEMIESEPLLDILRHRYAVGEINWRQFEEMRRVLGVRDDTPNVRQPDVNHAPVGYWPDWAA